MMTTKKRRRIHYNLVVVAAVGLLLTACGPPGAHELQQAQDDMQAGQNADAIVVLKDAIRILGDAPPAMQAKVWNLLGLAYMNSGQLEGASQAYGKALKMDRNNAVIDFNLGWVRFQQGNYPGAIEYFTTYILMRPKEVEGYLRRGEAYYHFALERPAAEQSRFFEAARHDFEMAEKIRITPEAANALGVLALQRRLAGTDYVHVAATNFGVALKRDPHFAPAMLNMAIVSQQYLHNPPQALKYYHQYLAVDPPPPHAKEVGKVATNLDLSIRITFTPESVAAPAPAPVPRPSTAPPPNSSSPKNNGAPSNPIAAVAVTKPPPAQEAPVEVVAPTPAPIQAPTPVPPRPEPPTTSPTQPVAVESTPSPQPQPQPQLQPSTAPVAPPVVSQAPAGTGSTVPIASNAPEPVVSESSVAPRKTLAQRLNPMNWFSDKSKVEEELAAARPAFPAEPPLVPPGTHYEYPPRVTPIPGDRAQAKRLLAEAVRARLAGDLKQSVRAYSDAVATDPTYYDACYGLGLVALETRDYPTALRELYRAMALQADSAEARYAFAWTLQRRGYTEDAVHELGRLLGQHSEDVRAHLLLGKLYAEKLGQPRLAREQFSEVLELDPKNAQAASIRAWMLRN